MSKRKPEKEPKESKDLMKWEPAKEFTALRKSFMDMFDDFWTHKSFTTLSIPSLSKWARGIWQPAIDIHETKKELVISASLPGINREDIKVNVENNLLTIKGERKEGKKVEKKDYYRREQTHGSFERNITLPDYVDTTKIKATYKNGVLEIIIPKVAKPKSEGKNISIE